MKTTTLLLMTALLAPLTGCDIVQAYVNGADQGRTQVTGTAHVNAGDLEQTPHLKSDDGTVVCDPPGPVYR